MKPRVKAIVLLSALTLTLFAPDTLRAQINTTTLTPQNGLQYSVHGNGLRGNLSKSNDANWIATITYGSDCKAGSDILRTNKVRVGMPGVWSARVQLTNRLSYGLGGYKKDVLSAKIYVCTESEKEGRKLLSESSEVKINTREYYHASTGGWDYATTTFTTTVPNQEVTLYIVKDGKDADNQYLWFGAVNFTYIGNTKDRRFTPLSGQYTEPMSGRKVIFQYEPQVPRYRPFYAFSHCCNSISHVDAAVKSGVNGVEFDISAEGETSAAADYGFKVSHPAPCPSECSAPSNVTYKDKFGEYLSNLKKHIDNGKLAMLLFDCKFKKTDDGAKYAQSLVNAVRKAGIPDYACLLCVDRSLATAIFDELNRLNFYCHRDVYINTNNPYSDYDSPEKYFHEMSQYRPTFHGVGHDPFGRAPMWKWMPWIQNLCNRRDSGTDLKTSSLRKVYFWTVDSKEDMKNCIDYGVDGLITNYPDTLMQVLRDTYQVDNDEKMHIRLAKLEDSKLGRGPWGFGPHFPQERQIDADLKAAFKVVELGGRAIMNQSCRDGVLHFITKEELVQANIRVPTSELFVLKGVDRLGEGKVNATLLTYLRDCCYLENVELKDPKFNGSGLNLTNSSFSLRILDLTDSAITDALVDTLIETLRPKNIFNTRLLMPLEIRIDNTGITKEGHNRLRLAFSKVTPTPYPGPKALAPTPTATRAPVDFNAAVKILEAGGQVTMSSYRRDGVLVRIKTMAEFAEARKQLPNNEMGMLNGIYGLAEGKVNESLLKNLKGCSFLVEVELRDPKFNGAGLENLTNGNGSLRVLDLTNSAITDAQINVLVNAAKYFGPIGLGGPFGTVEIRVGNTALTKDGYTRLVQTLNKQTGFQKPGITYVLKPNPYEGPKK